LPHLALRGSAAWQPPKFCRESPHPPSSGSVYRLRWSEFRIFEDVQSVASDRQLEEPLIFQGEIQQDVSRADEKHQKKRKTPTARNIGIKPNPQMPAPSRARRVQAQLNKSNLNLVSHRVCVLCQPFRLTDPPADPSDRPPGGLPAPSR
jgi:hypothetical protein